MKIGALAKKIEAIYELTPTPAIEKFLITTEQARTYIQGSEDLPPQVLIDQRGEDVFLGIHLGDERWKRIQKVRVERVTLEDFLSVTEEVSHFLYLAWCFQNGKPVTLLDVEFQGEIDKFLLAKAYFPSEDNLLRRLFENVTFDHHMDAEGLKRYREANRLGEKFCRELASGFETGTSRYEALQRLRAFYRLNTQARLSQVDRKSWRPR